jgi:hypothetical protein
MVDFVVYVPVEEYKEPITVFDVLDALVDDWDNYVEIQNHEKPVDAIKRYIGEELTEEMQREGSIFRFIVVESAKRKLEMHLYGVEIVSKEVKTIETKTVIKRV